MRNDIYQMFSDYRQSFKLKWGRIINAGFNKIADELEAESKKYNCKQEVAKNYIIWYDNDHIMQAMFCFPLHAKDFDLIFKTFDSIRRNKPLVTFIFINQESDGESNYDIFRISERSYLEHNNRVRYRTK